MAAHGAACLCHLLMFRLQRINHLIRVTKILTNAFGCAEGFQTYKVLPLHKSKVVGLNELSMRAFCSAPEHVVSAFRACVPEAVPGNDQKLLMCRARISSVQLF